MLPAILDIVKKGPERYCFTLIRSDRPFRAGSKVWEVQVDPQTVNELCDDVRAAVDAANADPDEPGINLTPFVALGKRLFDCLVPSDQADSLRRQLRELRMPLLISIDDPDVHWELMTDDTADAMLCLTFEIGRTLRTSEVPSWAPSRRREKPRCLLIANPEGNLPAAAAEALNLRAWLEERGVECNYLDEQNATRAAVRKRLLEENDIIHYAGHAELDALRLFDGDYSSTDIRQSVKGNPIVFLNGCVSARAVGGLADAFIAAGARVVVGSAFKAPDDGARAFAEKFYQTILGGQPAGAAMRTARRHVMGHADWGPAWACFVMYGDPCLRIELQLDELQASLAQIGLSRDEFDAGAGRVVERAVAYGVPMGGVETSHLFAALVGGGNPFLRDRLQEKRVAVEALEAAFRGIFKAMEGSRPVRVGTAGSVRYSSNARAILFAAKVSAQAASGRRISELDLLRGFVKSQGGGTRAILRSLGVEIDELDPDAASGGGSRD